MVLTIQLLRRIPKNVLRSFSTATETKPKREEPIQTFRTIESDPVNHNKDHLNRFYTLPPSTVQTVFQHGGLTKKFKELSYSFQETSILVREPAVEVISYLKLSDYSRPVNRYVLYGEYGTGKSVSLAHILHYGHSSGNLLVHVPWISDWYRKPKEVSASLTQEGFYDLPVDAAAWLVHFKHQNETLLKELDLRLVKSYEWSIREHTPCGTPVVELIDLGISRIKFACDIVAVLLDEIKRAAIAGKVKPLVVIDGYNALFGDDTQIRVENRKLVYPQEVTLTKPFIDIARSDWCNGAVVLSVDGLADYQEKHESYYPRYLLGSEGFETIDPFLPVHVENYSRDEFETVMEFWKNKKWIRSITAEGQRELELLTDRNPYKLMKYTASL